jgi:hypothetical protein
VILPYIGDQINFSNDWYISVPDVYVIAIAEGHIEIIKYLLENSYEENGYEIRLKSHIGRDKNILNGLSKIPLGKLLRNYYSIEVFISFLVKNRILEKRLPDEYDLIVKIDEDIINASGYYVNINIGYYLEKIE